MLLDLHFIWKSLVIVIGGVLILRLAGRKSISQLTVAQTVMMVAVGSLIIQPVSHRSIWVTMQITFLMVTILIFIEYIVLKSNALEKFIYGKSILVVKDGQLMETNLKKMRLTVDMLELRLRQQNIQNISDIKWATIESNGQLGYMLQPDKQYATKEDIKMLMELIRMTHPNQPVSLPGTPDSLSNNLYTEVENDQHIHEPPKRLK
jgi:uncharacterized membrane protein YcaP (DUF421 family)